jgi:hypothetical protein
MFVLMYSLFQLKITKDIGDCSRCWLSCLGSFVYCSQTLLSYLAFQYFDIDHTKLGLDKYCSVVVAVNVCVAVQPVPAENNKNE